MRTYYLEDGTVAPVGRELVVGNESWPKNLWPQLGEEKLTELGITWKDAEPPLQVDSKYQWPSGEYKALENRAEVDEKGEPVLDIDGKQLITRGLKHNAIQQVKQRAASLLQPTDYKVWRAMEPDSAPLSEEVLSYRKAVRAASNTIEEAILACSDVPELIALSAQPLDEDNNPVGNAPINDWPEAK